MAEENEPPTKSPISHADAMALADEAEAQAAEAEALAAAARARARAARFRHEAISLAEAAENYGDAAAAAADAEAAADDIAEDTATEADADDEEEVDDDYDDYDEEPAADRGDAAEEYNDDYVEGAADYAETLDEDTKQPRWRRRVPSFSTLYKVAAILLIFAFVGVTVYMVVQHHDTIQRRQREAAFVAGAKEGVVNMTSLDFKKAKEDVQRVIDSTTGEFRDDFKRQAPDFTRVVEESKATTVGTVNAAAIQSVNGNSAMVMVSATSRVINSQGGKEQPPRLWRLKVKVTEVGGQYKMSKVEYVP